MQPHAAHGLNGYLSQFLSEEPIVFPPLKWAGGKRWFVNQYADSFPKWSAKYYEPFFGSGAAFFHLSPEESVLGNVNSELIKTYRVIRENWREVHTELETHQAKHSKSHYYKVRDIDGGSRFEKAARFIYLNRTFWNGLYRVNLAGEFNVPKGTKTSVILETDNFAGIASRLKRATLLIRDFEEVLDQAGADDFAFIDPPYTVKHN